MKHNEEMNEWCRQLEHLHLPRWNELPELDLYMDQVVTLIERHLGLFFADKQEKMLTKLTIQMTIMTATKVSMMSTIVISMKTIFLYSYTMK